MHTLSDLESLANQLLRKTFTFKANGITNRISPKHDLGYSFKFDSAKSRLGCCHYGPKLITMSRVLSQHNIDKIHTKLTDTLLHEIAHALCVEVYGVRNGRGHGQNWVSIAKQIGCDGKRCYDGSKMEKPKAKWTLTCPTCNTVASRHRKPKYAVACASCCNGTYDERHKFIIKQNH